MAEETSSSSSAPPIGDNASMASALGADEAIAPTIFADGEVAIASGMGMESSNIHTLAASSGTIEASTEDKPQFTTIDEADRHLPVANISRIMKKVLPTNAQVSKDTKSYIQLCVSEFISFITSEASDKCMQEKRKTINGDVRFDILLCSHLLHFEYHYILTFNNYNDHYYFFFEYNIFNIISLPPFLCYDTI